MNEKNQTLYRSDSFSIEKNGVVQGNNVAKVISSTHLKSNYNSPENERYSNLVSFKFSINEKDNDLPQGVDRQILLTGQKESKVLVFGKKDTADIPKEPTILPTDYTFTFKVDMNAVLKQFEKKGYYEAVDGSKIAKSDFKGLYLAGGSLPLTWDFVNLEERGLKMLDNDNDGIYEITLVLNPLITKEEKEWKLGRDISTKAQYSSDQPLVDALYNLSLEEALLAIEPDSTFRTGAKWAGVWTRDISYSIVLAFAYLEPEVAKISLLKKVKRHRIVQDTGSGGAWPVSSDRTTWALAAWEVYKATGDQDWLNKAYTIIKNTVEDDYKTIRSGKTGMYSGESSFLDWREQSYPKWMSNMDISVSQNLGTNVVHYQTHRILSKMGRLLGESTAKYDKIAEEIRNGINEYLWMENKGYYAQYLYGKRFLIPSPRYEALGGALAVIFDVADEEQSKSIIGNSPLTEFGATCIYPQIPGIPPYHNNGIWPFVQSYWNIAAAKVGNEKVLNHGLAAIYRPAALFLTNYENMVAETGDFRGTEINSHRMLWSMAGNLAMVYRVFMGMKFEEDQLVFRPVIPKNYRGQRSLKNFKYRNTMLDIVIDGYGNEVLEVTLDGKKVKDAMISASLKGKHSVHITMKGNDFSAGDINLVENRFSLPTPVTSIRNGKLVWESIEEAASYTVYKNGEPLESLASNEYGIDGEGLAEFMVSAIDADGYESFASEPLAYTTTDKKRIEVENFAPGSNLPYVNYSGNGFVEVSKKSNLEIEVSVKVPKDGAYFLDVKYSNGSGPWNTDNKCAIRSLYVNDEYLGALVLPQRGTDEWSDWGYSNSYRIDLKKGKNRIKLAFEDWNNNMNVDVNTAMLDFIRLIHLD